jgi:hypothetical protein
MNKVHFLKRRSFFAALVVIIFLLSIASSYVKGSFLVGEQVCANLFRTEPQQDDSLPPEPHTPSEAQDALLPRIVTMPEVDEDLMQSLTCQEGLPLLPTEPVTEGPGETASHFRVSPSGEQLAHYVFLSEEDSKVALHNLVTGERRLLEDHEEFLLSWLNETHLFLLHRDSSSSSQPYLLDTTTGDTTDFSVRWQYDAPEAARFAGPLYTGWQAAEVLDVSKERICSAVRLRQLHTVQASDGTLLLQRDELLEQGGGLVRKEYPDLLTSNEIAALRSAAQEVQLLHTDWNEAPTYQTSWPYTLVLRGLPRSPHNLLVRVNSESLWAGLEPVPNQRRIYREDRQWWADDHPDFLVAPNLCPGTQNDGYRYVLYRKPADDSSPHPLGIIPYPIGQGSEIVWSPDEEFIYINQEAFGRHSVSRVRLPPN